MLALTAETVGDVITYLDPGASAVPVWPPDAFAIAAMLLKKSGAYRQVANAWPPPEFADTTEWHNLTEAISARWRASCDANDGGVPAEVKAWWEIVIIHATMPISQIASDRGLFIALVAIVAVCDFACSGFGFRPAGGNTPKEDRANSNLSAAKTLCESIHPSRCIVLPKAHNSFSGMTLRSLTHNLALWDRPEVSTAWENIRLDIPKKSMNLLLVPWPLKIEPDAFRPAANCHELRLPERVGLFEYDIPFRDEDIARIATVVKKARTGFGDIHGIILPELAMSMDQFTKARSDIQEACNIPLLISGVGGPNPDRLGTNNVAISIHKQLNEPYLQSKHHRWRIDSDQADSYDLKRLPPKKQNGGWWEGIAIENRSCAFFNANDWLTFCVLICEDLARQDPVSELVRSVGPSLVIALLLDGAQVRTRWPARYATVLAEDPRSSVLTLTAAGLVDLGNRVRDRKGKTPLQLLLGTLFGHKPRVERSVALWREAFQRDARPIILEPGSQGVVLKIGSKMAMEWTADGRHDDEATGYLSLLDISQVS